MSSAVFIIVELLFLAATHIFGGPPWAVIGALAVVLLAFRGVRIESLALMVPSLAWLALSHATGNRELFFPYTMYLASCVALRDSQRAAWLGPLGGAVVVAAFMVIRILQQATVRVLAVELVVAAAILALVVATGSWSRRRVAHVAPAAHFAWRSDYLWRKASMTFFSLPIECFPWKPTSSPGCSTASPPTRGWRCLPAMMLPCYGRRRCGGRSSPSTC